MHFSIPHPGLLVLLEQHLGLLYVEIAAPSQAATSWCVVNPFSLQNDTILEQLVGE